MTDPGGVAALISSIVGALALAGGAGRWLFKRFPPRSAGLADDVADLRSQLTTTQADMRRLTDYVHDLREHIALGKPPPPPDWPEGLRL